MGVRDRRPVRRPGEAQDEEFIQSCHLCGGWEQQNATKEKIVSRLGREEHSAARAMRVFTFIAVKEARVSLDSERMRPSSLSKLKRSACKRVSGSGGSILCPKQFAKIDHFIARIQ